MFIICINQRFSTLLRVEISEYVGEIISDKQVNYTLITITREYLMYVMVATSKDSMVPQSSHGVMLKC